MDDLKNVLNGISDLSAAVKKLVDTVKQTFGRLYEPIYIPQAAKARAEEIEIISAAISAHPELPIKYNAGYMTIDSSDFNELMNRANNRNVYQELIKQQNIESVVGKTAVLLEAEETVSETPVDKDWASRFFDSVANISSEEMQVLWAKLLAGEVKQPGSFSFRTMEALKNMTSEEAQLFQKVAPFIVDGGYRKYIPSDRSFLERLGISYLDILKLSECGLVSENTVVFKFYPKAKDNVFLKNSKEVILGRDTLPPDGKRMEISIGVHLISETGEELLGVIDVKPDEGYMGRIANYVLDKKVPGFEMSICSITDDSDESEFKYNLLYKIQYHKD